jgi:hypothetical protein
MAQKTVERRCRAGRYEGCANRRRGSRLRRADMATVAKYQTSGGETRYRGRYRTPEGRQTDKRGFDTKRDADAFAASVEVAKLKGQAGRTDMTAVPVVARAVVVTPVVRSVLPRANAAFFPDWE